MVFFVVVFVDCGVVVGGGDGLVLLIVTKNASATVKPLPAPLTIY